MKLHHYRNKEEQAEALVELGRLFNYSGLCLIIMTAQRSDNYCPSIAKI